MFMGLQIGVTRVHEIAVLLDHMLPLQPLLMLLLQSELPASLLLEILNSLLIETEFHHHMQIILPSVVILSKLETQANSTKFLSLHPHNPDHRKREQVQCTTSSVICLTPGRIKLEKRENE
jgi:hypothetical protein